MELSPKVEYALLALLELTAWYEQQIPVRIQAIADRQQLGDRYLEQILATLRRGGLVRSQRGAKGGYLLARDPRSVTLFDAIECMEGNSASDAETASVQPTPSVEAVREIWQEMYRTLHKMMQKYTLQDLYERQKAKQPQDIMYYI